MKSMPEAEVKANFSAILRSVSAGEEIAITRHGEVIARIVPEKSQTAADVFRPFWESGEFDVEAPNDLRA